MWHVIVQRSYFTGWSHDLYITLFNSDQVCVLSLMRYLKLSVWVWIQILKNVRLVGMTDSRLLTQHYTLLIIFALSERGGRRGATAQRWDGAEEEEDGERRGRGGEWRQQRRVRKPQITTINHQAVNIFTCYDGLLLAAAWDLCVCIGCILCVCMCVCSVLPILNFSPFLTVFASP